MKKVVVGMSGGVDSSVCAYLLKQQGYEVHGVFMKNWDSALNNDVKGNKTINDPICQAEVDYQDVIAVCEQLEISYEMIDFVEEYWQRVFTYFLDEYKKYRTPNPDVMCNKEIKFKAFLNYAKSIGADYVATGHYAKIDHIDGKPVLLRAKDQNKDQTYFLSQLSEWQLADVLFPLGDYEKSEIRNIAEEVGLATAKKKDSTGICFIGERDFKEFLSNYLPAQKGEIVSESGIVLGQHTGLMYYTIGQRSGLYIGGAGGPWFVYGKNIQKNQLLVTNESHIDLLYTDGVLASELNIINDSKLPVTVSKGTSFDCTAKFRYRQADENVRVTFLDETRVRVDFERPIRAITPGQAAVFYLNDTCLGGATIDQAIKSGNTVDYL